MILRCAEEFEISGACFKENQKGTLKALELREDENILLIDTKYASNN